MEEIIDFLNRDDVDVPETRKDLSKEENIKWLVNNLGIRNKNVDGFTNAESKLRILFLNSIRIA